MEHKFTEEEIIKALQLCTSGDIYCDNCPYENTPRCRFVSLVDALDLIMRQKAEIEKLREVNWNTTKRLLQLGRNVGVYDCVERVKSHAEERVAFADCWSQGGFIEWLDNLAKEMMENTDE